MNTEIIARALGYHGPPMLRIWEDERGPESLKECGAPDQINYSVYNERQRNFTFQDRAKRLKMHQFFARKADDLYDKDLAKSAGVIGDEKWEQLKSIVCVMPPYEAFVNKNQDKVQRWRRVLEAISPGDILYGIVTKPGSVSNQASMTSTMMIQPLCTREPLVRFLKDIPLKAYIHYANIPDLKIPVDSSGKKRNFAINDYVCCEVLEISVDADRIYLGMGHSLTKDKRVHLGLVKYEEIPIYCRKADELGSQKFEEFLRNSREFHNPNIDLLYEMNGLNVQDNFSIMKSLKNPFPAEEYADNLHAAQKSRWAFRCVVDGIEHFKDDRPTEAFQSLNKALAFDANNVEGLVARGALYANKGSFLKAIEDFDRALQISPFHLNARKYKAETLVALGRNHEEENRPEEAIKAYKDCLILVPDHEQAGSLLENLQHPSFPQQNLYNNDINNYMNPVQPTTVIGATGMPEMEVFNESLNKNNSDVESYNETRYRNKDNISPFKNRIPISGIPPTNSTGGSCATATSYKSPYYVSTYTNVFPNEFLLDDDDVDERVQRLLKAANKHKKKKEKKSKKSKKSKRDTSEDEMDYKLPTSSDFKSKLSENQQKYERSIHQLSGIRDNYTEISTVKNSTRKAKSKERSESPPPKPPSMYYDENDVVRSSCRPSTSTAEKPTAAVTGIATQPPKLSFQLKRPVKMDKFGLVRIATPLKVKSTSPISVKSASKSKSRSRSRSWTRSPKRHYRSRSRSRSRTHSHSHARSYSRSRERRQRASRRTRSRSRSRSSSYERRRRRSRRSRTNSPYRSRSRSRSRSRYNKFRPYSPKRGRFISRRRTPSPFVPRTSPTSRRRGSCSSPPGTSTRSPPRLSYHCPPNKSGSPNCFWKRPGYEPRPSAAANKIQEDMSIEEIEESLNKAKEERKKEILSRDKDILKKSNGGIP